MAHDYASVICEYCKCTDYGDEPVNTGPWNMCEGVGCELALDAYNDCHSEEEQLKSLEEAFQQGVDYGTRN